MRRWLTRRVIRQLVYRMERFVSLPIEALHKLTLRPIGCRQSRPTEVDKVPAVRTHKVRLVTHRSALQSDSPLL
jgi:hypothetical protein